MSHFHIIKRFRAVINLKSEGLRKDVRFEKFIYEIQKKMYFYFRLVPDEITPSFQQISAPVRISATLHAIFRREDGIFYIQAIRRRFGIGCFQCWNCSHYSHSKTPAPPLINHEVNGVGDPWHREDPYSDNACDRLRADC